MHKPPIDIGRRQMLKLGALAPSILLAPGSAVMAVLLKDYGLREVVHSSYVMGQVANVTFLVEDALHGSETATVLFKEFRRLESLLSLFDPDSDISRINRNAGRCLVTVSEETMQVVTNSIAVASRTRSALDITLEPLMRLWGFRGITRREPPTDRQIVAALDTVGIDRIVCSANSIGLQKRGAAIDLGATAVGFALDRAADIARKAGIERGLIELSGDFIAIGTPPEGNGWPISIVDPRLAYQMWSSISIQDQALSTSANYNNVVVYRARRYGHILDPARGRPSDALVSATVVAPTAFRADALSTALFATGDPSIVDHDTSVYTLKHE